MNAPLLNHIVQEVESPAVDRPHPGERALPSRRPAGFQRPWHNQYLPTLFDRLCDDEPDQLKESTRAYTATRGQMRAIVQRDLTLLLNTTNRQDLLDAVRHAQILSSTLNYGLPAMAGSYLSDNKWVELEKVLRRAVLDYEPRLLPDSVVVQPLMQDESRANYNVLLFQIQGQLYMEPYPVEFTVQSAVDLETSRVTLREA